MDLLVLWPPAREIYALARGSVAESIVVPQWDHTQHHHTSGSWVPVPALCSPKSSQEWGGGVGYAGAAAVN